MGGCHYARGQMRRGLRSGASAVAFCFWIATIYGGPLQLAQTIPLPGVEGRIDHFAFEAAGDRLFVCALGNNSVEVIDLRKGERVHSITGLDAPQGIVFVPEFNRLFVADDEGGICHIYDSSSFQPVGRVNLHDDADNMRYDSATKEILVGFGNGGVALIDAASGKQVGAIKLAAHPEAFELEKNGRRIFVNVPNARQVAVIDRDKAAVIATWQTDDASGNFPMALDETNRRLFVGCRDPAKLIVLDTGSGAVVASVNIAGDPDDIFYDAKRRRLYVVCGAGSVNIIEQANPNIYKLTAKIPTASGARTGFFAPEQDSLFVAVPHKGSQPAEIRRYQNQ